MSVPPLSLQNKGGKGERARSEPPLIRLRFSPDINSITILIVSSRYHRVVAFASELDSIFSLDDDLVKDPPGDESHTQLPELTSTVEDNARVNELDKKLKAKYDTLSVSAVLGIS